MPRLVLVRHGRPDGTWGRDPDPGLDATGRQQASAVATVLSGLGPLPIVVSPLRRTRETATPLAERWGIAPVVEPGIGELVAPADPVPDHATWLHTVMSGRGADAPDVIEPFRNRVLGAIRAISADSVVVTHFLAINVVVGAAEGDDRVVLFAPAHCSRTVVDVVDGRVSVVELGQQGSGSARI
ncbi:MAG: histidine phosphatase family protein [Acidimicrobiia bacterium]|nr:histidine phosphatase family protein [Acidimicrobiia bacterium]